MVAQLIKLRWRLFINGLKRNKWQMAGVIFGLLYMAFILALCAMAILSMGPEAAPVAQKVAVILVGVVVFGWTVVPSLVTGMDTSMDPQRFALFPIPQKSLATGLLLAGFIGVPGVATLIFMLLAAGTFLSSVPFFIGAIVAGLLSALTAQVFARALTALLASTGVKRGIRELGTVVLFIPLMLVGPAAGSIADSPEAFLAALPKMASIVGYTPFGAFLGSVWGFADGQALQGVLSLIIAVVSLAAGLWLYGRTVAKATVSPPRVIEASAIKGLGWVGRMPATPWGAIAGRGLTYWLKDARYSASLVMVPILILALGVLIPLTVPGNSVWPAIVPGFAALLMGFAISADVSYDTTAFHLHAITGVRGWQDRLGRVVGVLPLGIVVTLVAVVVPLVVVERLDVLVATLGMAVAALLVSLGLSSVVSARWTYAVPLPGESPFKTPPGAGSRIMVTQLLFYAVTAVFLAPAIWLYAMAWNGHDVLGGVPLLGLGLVWGGAVCVFGIWLGGKWYDRTVPELMQTVIRNG